MYYFNNIYIEGGEEIKEKCKENEKQREWEKQNFFLFLGYILQETGNPFIGFPNGFH